MEGVILNTSSRSFVSVAEVVSDIPIQQMRGPNKLNPSSSVLDTLGHCQTGRSPLNSAVFSHQCQTCESMVW